MSTSVIAAAAERRGRWGQLPASRGRGQRADYADSPAPRLASQSVQRTRNILKGKVFGFLGITMQFYSLTRKDQRLPPAYAEDNPTILSAGFA